MDKKIMVERVFWVFYQGQSARQRRENRHCAPE